jgi:hypothetical protein
VEETNLGNIYVFPHGDRVVFVTDFPDLLAPAFKEMGVLIETQGNWLYLRANPVAAPYVLAYGVVYSFSKKLRKYAVGTAINLAISPKLILNRAEDLLSYYASIAVGKKTLQNILGKMKLSLDPPKVKTAPLAALHALLFGRLDGDRVSIYFTSPVWYGVYRRYVKYGMYYCGNGVYWCGLFIKDEEKEKLKALVRRYVEKPPPLDPFLKWLGE